MNKIDIQPAILIETKHQLVDMITALKNSPIIGVDTESNSLYEYQEKICLIQFSSEDKDYIVDTIMLKDISNLDEIFSSNKIEKVFHAAEYDLMCLKRDYQFEFINLFDTMVASRILGFKSFGLSSLLNDFFHIDVEKKYQRANWGIRPLPDEMIAYAQMDTHFLIKLRSILQKKLVEQRKWDLASEDFKRLTFIEAFINNKNHDHYWRIIKGNVLTPQQENVLIELFFLREGLAEQSNRPPFKVFGNQVILEIAKKMPNNISQLESIVGLSPRLIQKYGEKIIKAISIGASNVTNNKKEKNRPDSRYLMKYDALKQWRKQKAIELDVESDIVLPKDHLEQIAHLKKSEISEIQKIMENIPYRFERFGKEILNVLGELEIK
jgi:ribonuclease D